MNNYTNIPFEDVEMIATDMRRDILKMVHSCGKQNGHLGGCMSSVEILAVLYTQIMNINEIAHSNKDWSLRDRFIMSKGHAGIAMYAAMKHVGLLSQEIIDGPVRGKDNILFRHPKRNIKYGIECSVGSLGMGLGYGNGLAEAFKRKGTTQKVYVMIGDGECNEGSVWESVAYASHRKLDNIIVIVDKNKLQLDGPTIDVLDMDNMAERWKAFGFETVEINGHDINEIKKAFETEHVGKPLAIIANTIKGKGMSFAENRTEWHDNYLSDELYQQGLSDLQYYDLEIIREKAQYRFDHKSIIISKKNEKVEYKLDEDFMKKCASVGSKNTIGEAVYELAKLDKKIALIYSDCANRIGIDALKKSYPECCYEVGIAEQNQVCMAAAMAHEGFHVFAVAYAPFITARVLDQIRANLGYMKAPVCLIGLGAGMASSDLGATHTAFEDIANLRGIPSIIVNTPCDAGEIAKSMEQFLNKLQPIYLRITIATPDVLFYDNLDNYDLMKSDVVFEGKDALVIATGTIISEAKKAVESLRNKGKNISLINIRTIKPMDSEVIDILGNYKKIITVEEHSVIGGLGSMVAEEIAKYGFNTKLKMIGIEDEYFCADVAKNIFDEIGLNALGIETTIMEFLQ